MARDDMKVKLVASEELQRLMSTRVWICRALDCRFNEARRPPGSATCNLQRVEISRDGRCQSFELEAEDE